MIVQPVVEPVDRFTALVRSEAVTVDGRQHRVGGEEGATAEGGQAIVLTFRHVEEVKYEVNSHSQLLQFKLILSTAICY